MKQIYNLGRGRKGGRRGGRRGGGRRRRGGRGFRRGFYPLSASYFFPYRNPYFYPLYYDYYGPWGDPLMFKESAPYDSRPPEEIEEEEKKKLKKLKKKLKKKEKELEEKEKKLKDLAKKGSKSSLGALCAIGKQKAMVKHARSSLGAIHLSENAMMIGAGAAVAGGYGVYKLTNSKCSGIISSLLLILGVSALV